MAADLVAHCVSFCRALREHGIPVTPGESVLAARVLEAVDVADSEDVRLGLRAALAVRHEHFRAFDAVFAALWMGARTGPGADEFSNIPTRTTKLPNVTRPPRVTLESWMRAEEAPSDDPIPLRVASDREAMTKANLADFDNDGAEEFRRLAERIARRLALRSSRRWRSARRGAAIDLRRTARQSLRTGGDAIQLARRTRKIRRTRLVALCDVSGSMELYARFLLQFLHALQRSFAQVETFVFSTRLTRTSPLLDRAQWDEAVVEVAREVTDWSGGTRIGASLTAFVDEWIRLLDARTVVVVMSDGWETGDPAVLADALRTMHERAGRIIWLNPLLSSSDYTPAARGMQAVLPFIDRLASCHNLASLERLVRELAI